MKNQRFLFWYTEGEWDRWCLCCVLLAESGSLNALLWLSSTSIHSSWIQKGASQYHRAERRLQFFNISLASWVLPQPESDQCHSLWDIAHYTGGEQRLLDLWGNIGEDRAPVWKKSPLGLPRWVYQRAWRLIRQTRLRQIKRDREGLSSERR